MSLKQIEVPVEVVTRTVMRTEAVCDQCGAVVVLTEPGAVMFSYPPPPWFELDGGPYGRQHRHLCSLACLRAHLAACYPVEGTP